MGWARWIAGLSLLVAAVGCESAERPADTARPGRTTEVALSPDVTTEASSSSVVDGSAATSNPAAEPAPAASESTTEEPSSTATTESVQLEPATRASELRAQFREAHPDLVTDLPEGASCDDEVEDLGRVVVAGCVTSTAAAIWFLVPEDPAELEETWQFASSELLANACIGDDHVVGAFSIEGANVVAQTFPGCAYP